MKRVRNYKLYTDVDYEALKTQPRANDFLEQQFSSEPNLDGDLAVAQLSSSSSESLPMPCIDNIPTDLGFAPVKQTGSVPNQQEQELPKLPEVAHQSQALLAREERDESASIKQIRFAKRKQSDYNVTAQKRQRIQHDFSSGSEDENQIRERKESEASDFEQPVRYG